MSVQIYCQTSERKNSSKKQTILILGGTPSTVDILNDLPDSLKSTYTIISFNRPGFGGSNISELTKDKLISLAKEAGLKKNDFGIIGISGGAPLAILLADAFKIKHCGIISGMVSEKAYFQFADSTFTKDFFKPVTESFENFEKVIMSFPNLDAIVQQAGARSKDEAIKASYNELHFILSKNLYKSMKSKSMPIEWWHGENDRNVAIESVKLFLKDYQNATLNIIPKADHYTDARVYIKEIIKNWEK
jgi:pimeloyl-ACP methyl ester carboxylesterase